MSIIEIINEEFESLHSEESERKKLGHAPFSSKDYQDRFARISTRLKEDVGIGYDVPILILLYGSFTKGRV